MRITIVDDNGIRVSRNIGAHSLWSQAREAMEEGHKVSVEFDALAEIEHLAAGDDVGWFNADHVAKHIDKLQDQCVMASQNMSNVETGEAAREWATRLRACEKAILELRTLAGGV